MAVKTFHFLNTTGATPNFLGSMQADGTAPSAVVSTAGWQVAKTAVSTPFFRGRWGATAKATAAQASPGYIAGTSGPAKGTGTGITTAGDSFVTPASYNGTFASGAWTVTLAARPTTITAVGRMRMRVWASTSNEGLSPRELTSGALVGSIVTMSSTTTTYTSTITWSPAAITLVDEYLFFQIEWEETTAGTSNSTALGLYIGTARIVTTDFVAAAAPNYAITHYRWRSDAAAVDATPTWYAAEDTATTYYLGSTQKFCLRIGMNNTGGSKTTTWQLQYMNPRVSGSWVDVTTSSAGIRSFDASSSADETAIAVQRLTTGTGTWQNGRYDETGVLTPFTSTGGTFTEFEFGLQVIDANVIAGDDIKFMFSSVTDGISVPGAGLHLLIANLTADAWSAADKSATITLSNNDKTATSSQVSSGVRSTTAHLNTTAGKYYAEFLLDAVGATIDVGFKISSDAVGSTGSFAASVALTGSIRKGGASSGQTIGSALIAGDVLCMAWDSSLERVWFRKNSGLWNNDAAANPATGTNGLDVSTFTDSVNFSLWMLINAGTTITLRTERAEFTQAVPEGFESWMGEVLLQADKGSYLIDGGSTGVPIVTPWTEFNSYLSGNQIAENGAVGVPHYVRRDVSFIAGDQYQYSIEYLPSGPNPRGLSIQASIAGAGLIVTGSNTGVEAAFSNSANWTMDQHSVTSVGGGYYKLLMKGTRLSSTGAGYFGVYLYSTSTTYNGLDNGSGVFFQNYKQLHYSRFDAAKGTYGITGNDATLTKSSLPKVLTANYGKYLISTAIGPTVGLNLVDLLSCSRSSIGYAQGSNGTLVQFPANTLRVTDLGLLVEDTRTNILRQSGDPTNVTFWNNYQLTLTSGFSAPDGTTTAYSLVDVAVNDQHVSLNISTITAGTSRPVTVSCYLKQLSGNRRILINHVDQAINGYSFEIDTSWNVIVTAQGSGASNPSYTLTPLANGWYYFTATVTCTSTANSQRIQISLMSAAGALGYLGDGASGFYVWGCQIEEAAFASSYIPTTSAAATRAADVVTTTGSLDSLLIANVCSVVLDMKAPGTVDLENKNGGSHWIQSATGQMIVGTDYNFQNTKPNSRWQGMLVGNIYGNSLTLSEGVKVGVSWDAVADTLSLVGGGGAVGTMSMPGAVPLVSPVSIGRGLYTATHYFGYFRRFIVWDTRLSDVTLQALTAP